MNFTRRLSDGLVQYASAHAMVLTNTHLSFGGFTTASVTSGTHEIISDVVIPENIVLNGCGYSDGSWAVVDTVVVERHIISLKLKIKAAVKVKYDEIAENAVADTGLGFTVDAKHNDIINFGIGKKYYLPQAKAANNTLHNVDQDGYDTIIAAIEINGIRLLGAKWAHETAIDSLTTVKEVMDYDWSIGW